MKNAHMRWGLGAALILVTGSLAMATTTQASAASPPNACGSQIQAKARAEGFGGVVPAIGKHVESCFFAGSTTTAANACTINYQPSAAYCAYHNEANSSAIYANMLYPIYLSKVGFTCGTEKNFGAIQSPNGNPDADVEISPTSHEISESITDPDTLTGWYDSSGFENGDECAYVFGQTQGSAGHLYNQVINGLHFLTQEEFSNRDFAITGGGCVQSASAEAP